MSERQTVQVGDVSVDVLEDEWGAVWVEVYNVDRATDSVFVRVLPGRTPSVEKEIDR